MMNRRLILERTVGIRAHGADNENEDNAQGQRKEGGRYLQH